MSLPLHPLVIDARPRGPRGPFAGERVQGGTVLEHLLDIIERVRQSNDPVVIYARPEEHSEVSEWSKNLPSARFVIAAGAPPEGSSAVRTDRLYDHSRLLKALKRGDDPESAVIWRLDRPHALAGADDELTRRQTYQPLGRYWALGPARALARALAPTPVRPNALTITAAGLVLSAAGVVASPWQGVGANLFAAVALALGLVLDTADGHLARLQGTSSEFGRWLDGWLDEVGDMALHAAIAWSLFARTGEPRWLLVGTLYAAGKYVFFMGNTGLAAEKTEGGTTAAIVPQRPSPLAAAVRLAGHADLRWHLWIVLALLGRLDVALVAYAAYFPARAVAHAIRKGVRRG